MWIWIFLVFLAIVSVAFMVARNHDSSGQTIRHIDGRR
jgi:hypothetical protein